MRTYIIETDTYIVSIHDTSVLVEAALNITLAVTDDEVSVGDICSMVLDTVLKYTYIY